nr:hypothetical protein NG677_20075 [Methylobacterium sp. OTU13CASTA1]
MPNRAPFYILPSEIEVGTPALQQGDVLNYVPFPLVKLDSITIVKGNSSVSLNATNENFEYDGSHILTSFAAYPAIIITQTCDLERGDRPVIVCAIRSYSEIFPDQEIGSSAFINRIRDFANPGKKPNALLMPPLQNWEAMSSYSVADLGMMSTVFASSKEDLVKMRKARLSPAGLALLQERLSASFSRFAAPDGILFSDQEYAKVFSEKK